MDKPRQSFWGLWNISFGFFGIQIAFGLQNGNVSRIFQTLGSPVEDLAILWIAGPITGLLVQPVIGYLSDKTWLGSLGRRRPYFLAGAVLVALALLAMPNARILWVAAVFLWMLDASLNISMEPFRAFVGDMTPRNQRRMGYAMQTMFIGAGGFLGSVAPWIMTRFGVANEAAPGQIPDSVLYSMYIGAAAILIAVLWTVFTTREYSPEEMRAFGDAPDDHGANAAGPLATSAAGPFWLIGGVLVLAAVWKLALQRDLYVLGGAMAAFGLAQILNRFIVRGGGRLGALSEILSDMTAMPMVMRRQAVAQFFTWCALFIMWIYSTPVITQYVYGSTDTTSAAYNEGANWVGWLFAIYNLVATAAAFLLPALARALGVVRTHMICLLIGAASFFGLFLIRDAGMLILPFIGIGIAWASILTMPYVILAGALPQHKLGIYMGIFNFFIVIPQLLVATIMGQVMANQFPGDPVWTMLIAAGVMMLAAGAMLRVPEPARS